MLAIDYRGFGDSTGSPTQSGLTLDAHTALEYVRARSAPDDDKGGRGPGVVLAGHSLGTGVIAQLMTDLSNNGECPHLALLAAIFA